MTKRQTTIITALSIAAFVLALMVSGRLWFRFDLTRNKAYTISKVSRNIHFEIPDHVNITYYISDRLKNIHPSPGEIEDTLREYAAYSRGKIRVTVRDPVKAGLVQTIEELGLQPRQFQTVEQDQASLATVFSGIVIEYLDKMELLPWIITTDTLEYDLTSRIRSLVRDTERRIGVIIGDSFRGWREDFSYLGGTLAAGGYRVRLIHGGEEIPESLSAVFVLGGVEDLDHWALYRIDSFIRQGGKVLFAVKGVFVDTVNATIEARHQEDQGLLEMIASYGVTIRPELALDRNALSLQYQTRTPTGVQYRIIRYPLWIGILPGNANSQHPIGARFQGLDLFWSSPLELHTGGQIEAVPLFTSTAEAWLMIDSFHTSPEVSYLLERDALQTRGTKILGAAVSGTFNSFFYGAPKPVREGVEEELPDMPRQARPSRIIVVGDTDFATDLINITGGSHNMDFLLRAADWLVSDDDIIGIRNRQPQAGRLDGIIDPDKRAAAILFSQVVNVGLIPLLVILAGLALAWQRRRFANDGRFANARSSNASSQNTDKSTKETSDGI
ncbi:MAG: GldG family protein [Treponema sp.]|nr:GldG family protein [Treponema sp.]